ETRGIGGELEDEVGIVVAAVAPVVEDDVVLEDVIRNLGAAVVKDQAPGRTAIAVDRVVKDVRSPHQLLARPALGGDPFVAVAEDVVATDDVAHPFRLLTGVARFVRRSARTAYDIPLEEV